MTSIFLCKRLKIAKIIHFKKVNFFEGAWQLRAPRDINPSDVTGMLIHVHK